MEKELVHSRFASWAMWFLASVFYAYQYILRVIPNILMPDLMQKFQIDADAFGQFSGLYYIGYAGLHLPLGLLLDRWGPKIVMPLCILLTVLGFAPLIYADAWIYPGVGRFLIGVGSSAAILGIFKIVRMCFEERKFTTMLGFAVTIGLLGAIYGGRPVSYLISIMGWEQVVRIMLMVGLVLAIAIYLIVPHIKKETRNTSMIHELKQVLNNKYLLLVSLLGGLMVGPLEGFADVWGTTFLKTVYGMEQGLAATLPSLIFTGMCIGSPLLSMFAEKTRSYLLIIIVSALVMGVGFIYMLTGVASSSMLTILMPVIGFFCAYQILVVYKASTYAHERYVGMATACANMIIMIFGTFFHTTIGKIMTSCWDGKMENGICVYDQGAYSYAISIVPAGLLIAAIGLFFIYMKEKNEQRHVI